MHAKIVVLSLLLVCFIDLSFVRAEEIGSVDTKFNLLGPDHKIVIEAFDDPKITGVTCHLSRSKKGGLKGMIGVAEDSSDASIALSSGRPSSHKRRDQEKAKKSSKKSRSLIFKKLQVVRFFDKKTQLPSSIWCTVIKLSRDPQRMLFQPCR